MAACCSSYICSSSGGAPKAAGSSFLGVISLTVVFSDEARDVNLWTFASLYTLNPGGTFFAFYLIDPTFFYVLFFSLISSFSAFFVFLFLYLLICMTLIS